MARKRIIGLGAASMVAAMLVLGFTFSGRTGTAAAQGSGDQPEDATSTQANDEQLADILITNFAARLNVDEATLNAAFTAAVGDTVDAAVGTGKMTAEEAAKIKSQAQDGLRALLLVKDQEQQQEKRDMTHPEGDKAFEAAWEAAGTMLGLDARQMKSELGSGKSLTDIAHEHDVDVQQLQDRMLTDGKAVLDVAVRDGKLTQDAADKEYARLTEEVTDFVSNGLPNNSDKNENTGDTE